MCGIVGFCKQQNSEINEGLLYRLMKESKIRGLHSFGFATQKECKKFREFPSVAELKELFSSQAGVFHARYSTSGDWHEEKNNQPLWYDGIGLALNGVISMKPREEYEKEYGIECVTDNDAEIFLRLLLLSPEEAIKKTKGAWAAIWVREGSLYAARNSYRPLFWLRSGPGLYVCSTADIAHRALAPLPEPIPVGKVVCLNDLL